MDVSYTVHISRRASKFVESSTGKTRVRIISALKELKIDPFTGSSKLKGRLSGLYRRRVGNYRVIIRIDNKERIVLVLSISDRGKAYKK